MNTAMKLSESCDPKENFILRALPPKEYQNFVPHLEYVTMCRGEILFDITDKVSYVYFPITFVASLVCCLKDGMTVEIATIGNDGIVGISAFLGGKGGLTEAIVFTTGTGYRISTKLLHSALERSGGRREGNLQKLLLRYTHALFIQMSQITACVRRHTIEQQLCRWLLLNFDRTSSDKLVLTQESIGNMLGVRRESITQAAKNLQILGAINHSRGFIELKDREKLENIACECYEIIKNQSVSNISASLIHL